MRLRGRVALVTGGAGGIGASVAERFAMEGAIVITADRDEDGAKAVAAGLPDASGSYVDVADAASVDELLRGIATTHGRVDVVAHIAGVDDPVAKAEAGRQLRGGEPLDITSQMTDQQWHRMVSINLNGTFYVVRAALRLMLPLRGGSIICMASAAGVSGVGGLPHYSATKHGVVGLTQSVAKEVAPRGVRINAIAPGGVNTAMLRRTPVADPVFGPTIPMGRFGEASEIAAVAAFLASDDSSYLTGETINVNGGALTV